MTDYDDYRVDERLDPVFEARAASATTAFWSPGRCLTLIVDGCEQEFPFRDAVAEARMLGRLRERGTTILPEAGPYRVVIAVASAGLAVLLLVSLMT